MGYLNFSYYGELIYPFPEGSDERKCQKQPFGFLMDIVFASILFPINLYDYVMAQGPLVALFRL